MFDFLWKVQYYLKCITELMHSMELNVLFSYLECTLYDHLLQIRFAKQNIEESFISSFLCCLKRSTLCTNTRLYCLKDHTLVTISFIYHHFYTITLSTLKIHMHVACVSRSRDTHHLLLIGSIKHHLDQGTCTTCSWWDQVKHHLNSSILLLSLLNINFGWNAHTSLHDWTSLKKILHHRCYWLLTICLGILHMECSSHRTTVLDTKSQS